MEAAILTMGCQGSIKGKAGNCRRIVRMRGGHPGFRRNDDDDPATSDDDPSSDAEAIAAIAAIAAAIAAAIERHKQAEQNRPSGREGSSKVNAERNALLAQIISHRIALQHAADRAYPPGNPLTTPSRTRFHLDPDRSFNG